MRCRRRQDLVALSLVIRLSHKGLILNNTSTLDIDRGLGGSVAVRNALEPNWLPEIYGGFYAFDMVHHS
jgi:hypothetical protein